MNFGQLRTQVESSGRFDTSQDTDVGQFVRAGYEKIWNEADWIFKKVPPTNVNVVSGTPTVVLPSDFGSSLKLYDQNGEPLVAMDAVEFDDYFRRAVATGQSGPPQAYKVVNRVLTLGPTPNVTATFTLSYNRRLCTFLANGTTVQAGPFSLDTDLPLWNPTTGEYHMLIVYAATIIGQSLESDLAEWMVQQLYDSDLQAMLTDFGPEDHGTENLQWGRDDLGLYI
jgi:hypothetical protein